MSETKTSPARDLATYCAGRDFPRGWKTSDLVCYRDIHRVNGSHVFTWLPDAPGVSCAVCEADGLAWMPCGTVRRGVCGTAPGQGIMVPANQIKVCRSCAMAIIREAETRIPNTHA